MLCGRVEDILVCTAPEEISLRYGFSVHRMHLLLFGVLVDCVKIILRVDHISPKIPWLQNLELDSV